MSRSRFALLVATILSLTASVGLVFGLLSEIQDEFGLTSGQSGLMMGTPFFTAVAAQLLLAPLADRGHSKVLLVGGALCAAIAPLGFVFGDQLWHFIIARGLSGIGLGAFLPAARAVVSRGQREVAGAMLGRLAGAELAGFILGPMLGVELVLRFNLSAPFVVLSALAGIFALLISQLQVDEPEAVSGDEPSTYSLTASLQLLRRPEIRLVVLVSAALFFPAGAYEAIWDRYLTDLGASTRFVGWSLAIYGVPFILLAPVGGKLADRFGGLRVGLMALAMVAPLTLLYGQVRPYQLLAGAVLFEAAFNALGIPAMQTAMVRATKPSELAAGQGLAGAFGQIGAGFASIVAGGLYEDFGAPWLFAILAAIIAVFGLIGVATWRSLGWPKVLEASDR